VTAFAWNLALAGVWAAVLGSFSLGHLTAGFGLGFVIIAIAGGRATGSRYVEKAFRSIEFAGFFLLEVVLSSLRVAADIVTPRHRARPGIVGIPLDARSDAEITLLANLISLTPGSLSLDLSPDRRTLFVHVMFLEDAEAFRAAVKNGFERRVLELLR